MKNPHLKALSACFLAALLLGGCGGGDVNQAGSAGPESGSPAPSQSVSVPGQGAPPSSAAAASDAPAAREAPGFELTDQYGTTHNLADYEGKVVFLNFWATWCPPCRAEMPDIEALYQQHAEAGEVVVLGVAMPETDENPNTTEGTAEEVAAFLTENSYTYPTLMDPTGEVFRAYAIRAFPTTFMIDKNGNVAGYVTGAIDRETMDSIIEQTEAITDDDA